MRPMQLNSDAMHWMHWENQGHSLRGDVTHSCLRTGCHWNKSRPSHCQLTKTNKQFCHSMSSLALSAESVKRISHPDLMIYWFWLEVNESMLAIEHRHWCSQCSNMLIRPCLNSTDRRRLKEYRLPSEERPNGSQKPKGAWNEMLSRGAAYSFAAARKTTSHKANLRTQLVLEGTQWRSSVVGPVTPSTSCQAILQSQWYLRTYTRCERQAKYNLKLKPWHALILHSSASTCTLLDVARAVKTYLWMWKQNPKLKRTDL